MEIGNKRNEKIIKDTDTDPLHTHKRDSPQNQQIGKFLCRALMLSVTLPRPFIQ